MIFRIRRRAGLTIEAAAILPVFSLALLMLLSVLTIQQETMMIQEEFFREAEESAINDTDEEYRQLSVSRSLTPLTGFFGLLSFPVERKCLIHTWCGYGEGYFPDSEIVYITEESEVYHRDRECSHIRLTVEETSGSRIDSLRNANGSRYKACNICHSNLSDKKLYITEDGDRYHNNVTCSALKRTVRAVRLSEVKDRRPCQRCGR